MDRTQRTLTDGSPITPDHRELQPSGQQKAYVVLSSEERSRGFVRPVRRSYVHTGVDPVMDGPVIIRLGKNGCGAATKMSNEIAETYARDPFFYSGTFCVGCGKHFPIGDDGEFMWEDGTKVGT
ncbi:hypothetical protein [Terrihabitans soli]|uniref:hypothetical protein n=1 Tax=Terrihabitans soli TaxID=708113 RepID=UPI001CA36762|nr:hypothetical protein [Terrihabitans soli]